MRDALLTDAKAGELRPLAVGDFVQVDLEPHFKGWVRATDGEKAVIHDGYGLFLAAVDELSILRRAP